MNNKKNMLDDLNYLLILHNIKDYNGLNFNYIVDYAFKCNVKYQLGVADTRRIHERIYFDNIIDALKNKIIENNPHNLNYTGENLFNNYKELSKEQQKIFRNLLIGEMEKKFDAYIDDLTIRFLKDYYERNDL